VNAYYSTGDRVLAVPVEGGRPRRISLPWQENLSVRGVRREPPALLIGHGRELWRVPLSEEAPVRLGLPPVVDAAWSPQGDRLAWIEDLPSSKVLCTGDSEGRTRTPLVVTPKREGSESRLSIAGWHPSGNQIRYFEGGEQPRVVVIRADGSEREERSYRPLPDQWSVSDAWTPDGAFLVLGTQRGMVALREQDPWHWLRRTPPVERIGGPTHAFRVRFTPDGRRLVAFMFRPSAEVFSVNAATGAVGPVVLEGTRTWMLVYSPDGSRVAWISGDLWPGRLWVSRPDGTERLALGDIDVRSFAPLTWSPNGRRIAFTSDLQRSGVSAPFRLYLASPAEGTVEPLTSEDPGAAQVDACWSPDGRWLAYGPDALSDKAQPFLRRVDLATRTVTRLEGSEGLWSPRCTADGRILAVDFSAQKAEFESKGQGRRRAQFKLREPATGRWTPLVLELPSGATGVLSYPNWSRDGRQVYANAGPWLVRWDVRSGRLAVVADATAFGSAAWPGAMSLDPQDNPLFTRDRTDREIVVMDVERR
jgi:Tol biopolymer transport system component